MKDSGQFLPFCESDTGGLNIIHLGHYRETEKSKHLIHCDTFFLFIYILDHKIMIKK